MNKSIKFKEKEDRDKESKDEKFRDSLNKKREINGVQKNNFRLKTTTGME